MFAKSSLMLVVLIVTLLRSTAAPASLRLEPTVVLGDTEDALIVRPVSLWSQDGRVLVLSAGDCAVSVFDPSTRELRHLFGACGEGPEELYDVRSVVQVEDRVYVFQGYRVTVLTADGSYVDVRRLEGDTPASILRSADRTLFAVSSHRPSRIVEVHPESAATVVVQDVEDAWLSLLSVDEEEIVALDLQSGEVVEIDRRTRETRTIDIGLSPGASQRRGQSVYSAPSVATACHVRGEGFLVVALEDQDPQAPPTARLYASDWGSFEVVHLDDALVGGTFVADAEHSLWLVNEQASLVQRLRLSTD